ncbi:MAG: integrase core domain-containing protein [Phycisphaerales bacterium]
MRRSAVRHGHAVHRPGAPWQNVIVESCKRRLRDQLLSSELLETLAETRYLVDRWRLHYNHRRPQRALGKLTPAAYAAACPAPPPLRLPALACASASPATQEAGTMPTLSQGVDR